MELCVDNSLEVAMSEVCTKIAGIFLQDTTRRLRDIMTSAASTSMNSHLAIITACWPG